MLMAFVFVLAIVVGVSDTAFGRSLRQALTRFTLPRPTRGQWAVAILLIVFGTALVVFLRTDGLAVGARALPEGIAWFASIDVAAYLDVVAVAALAAIALRLRFVWSFARGAGRRLLRRLRTIRRGRSGRAPKPRRRGRRQANDEDERWAGLIWAA